MWLLAAGKTPGSSEMLQDPRSNPAQQSLVNHSRNALSGALPLGKPRFQLNYRHSHESGGNLDACATVNIAWHRESYSS